MEPSPRPCLELRSGNSIRCKKSTKLVGKGYRKDKHVVALAGVVYLATEFHGVERRARGIDSLAVGVGVSVVGRALSWTDNGQPRESVNLLHTFGCGIGESEDDRLLGVLSHFLDDLRRKDSALDAGKPDEGCWFNIFYNIQKSW